jgi:hypothetical protein
MKYLDVSATCRAVIKQVTEKLITKIVCRAHEKIILTRNLSRRNCLSVRGFRNWPKIGRKLGRNFAFNQVFYRGTFILRHPEKFYGRLLSIISRQTCCGHFRHRGWFPPKLIFEFCIPSSRFCCSFPALWYQWIEFWYQIIKFRCSHLHLR